MDEDRSKDGWGTLWEDILQRVQAIGWGQAQQKSDQIFLLWKHATQHYWSDVEEDFGEKRGEIYQLSFSKPSNSSFPQQIPKIRRSRNEFGSFQPDMQGWQLRKQRWSCCSKWSKVWGKGIKVYESFSNFKKQYHREVKEILLPL